MKSAIDGDAIRAAAHAFAGESENSTQRCGGFFLVTICFNIRRLDADRWGKLASLFLKIGGGLAATVGSEVVFAILSNAAAACRAWKRFWDTVTAVWGFHRISEGTLIPFLRESTKVHKARRSM